MMKNIKDISNYFEQTIVYNESMNAELYLKNINMILDSIVQYFQDKTKSDNVEHSTAIMEDPNYDVIEKHGRSGDGLYMYRSKAYHDIVAIIKKLYLIEDLQADKAKEVVNSFYMGEKYSEYFPKVYDVKKGDNFILINLEFVKGYNFTEICKTISFKEMKEILFCILYAFLKIRNDKIFLGTMISIRKI